MSKSNGKLTEEQVVMKAKTLLPEVGSELVGEILVRYSQDTRYLHMAQSILHNIPDSEDAVQNAIVQAIRKWQQFRGQSKFSTWFTRIVITCSLMMLRKRQDMTDEIPERWYQASMDNDIYQEEIKELLYEAIEKLDKEEKEIILMRVKDELSFREISKKTGTALGTCKNVAIGAYRKLQCLLAEDVNTDQVSAASD